MFHDIPPKMLERMKLLENQDREDRADGTPRMQRLRQVGRETGELLAMLLAIAPPGLAVEIGTSAGYSALWLSLACRTASKKLATFELLPEKIALARETFAISGVEDVVALVEGDAIVNLQSYSNISFAFIDTEKEIYQTCYDILIPRMASGGIIAADNVVSHAQQLAPFLDYIKKDIRADATIIHIDNGLLLCRKV